ncbi:MAG: MarR family transcriptional regulator [Actinobacteria bacterium HGW-Actinobacteria-4]|nr:MAG: MarR family transcriptional regulator [Actinobacteria bacterium HGW-Actinobacteria-4]
MESSARDSLGVRGGDVELAALSIILARGPVSRTELAARLSLSQSTMTRAAKPLLDRGLVVETSEPLEGPGRPSRPLVAAPGDRRFVGVKLTGDEAFAVLTDIVVSEIATARRSLESHEPAVVVKAVTELVRELAGDSNVVAVGVSLGGSAVDGRTVDRAPFLGWRDVPLADFLENNLQLPVIVDNDLSALTAGEHWFGLGRGVSDFAVVTIGAGIGLGLVRDDQVVRIRDMGLGLAGHIPLDPAGPRCIAGHRGCSTAVLSIPSIEAQASVALQRKLDFSEIITLAREGDTVCSDIVTAAARGLGRLLALVANLAMVEVVVLSGEGLALLDVAGSHMRQQLAEDRDPDSHSLEIRIDDSGFPGWARGAATVAIQSSLRNLIRPA